MGMFDDIESGAALPKVAGPATGMFDDLEKGDAAQTQQPVAAPATEAPKEAEAPGFVDALKSAVTDYVPKVKKLASEALEDINPFSEKNTEAFRRNVQGPITPRLSLTDSSAVGGVGKLAAAPFQAAIESAAPPIAAGMANLARPTEKLIGTLGGKEIPETSYEEYYKRMEPGVETALGLAIPTKGAPVTLPRAPDTPFGVSLYPAQETRDLQALKQISDATRGRLGKEVEAEAVPRLEAQRAEVAQAPERAVEQLSPTGTIGAQNLHDVGQIVTDHLTQQATARTAAQTRGENTLLQLQDRLRSQFGNGRVLADTPEAGADIMARGLERADEQARAARDAAYERWSNMDGTYNPRAFVDTTNRIRRDLSDPDRPFLLNDQTPNARGFLDYLDENLVNPAKTAADPATQSFTPFTPRRIDNVRKQLTAYQQAANSAARSSNNYSDVAALQRMRDVFERQVADATRNPRLFSGDGRAVWQAWQDARAAHANWRQTFSSQGTGDRVGPTINKILGQREGQAAPPQEIVNWITGKGATPTLVGRRMQQIFGADSPEIATAKQMNWSKAVDAPDGSPPLTNLQKAKNIDVLRNSDLGRTYFTPPELQQMGQLSGAMRRAAAAPGADPIAEFTAKIQAGGGMPPMEVARTLIPSGQAVDKTFPLALARHLKQTLPPERWDAVRQGVMRDLLTPPREMANPHNAVVNRIDGAFKNAPDIMNQYFSPQEQGILRAYQDMSRKLSMPQAAVQTSNHPNYLGNFASAIGRVARWVALDAVAHGVGIPMGWAELGSKVVSGYMSARADKKATGALVNDVAKLMPSAAERMGEYQRAVAAVNKTNNAMTRNRVITAINNIVNLFKNYGIDLTKIPTQSPVPAGAGEQNQQRAEGGAVNRPFGGGVGDDEPIPAAGNPISAAIMQHPVLPIGIGPGFVGAQAPGAAPAPKPAEEAPVAPTEPAPPLYSAVEKAVQAAPQNKASPEQWQGYLKNQPGVKPDELDWIGMPEPAAPNSARYNELDKKGISNLTPEELAEFHQLDANPPTPGKQITRDQLLQHIGENKLQLEEQEYGQPTRDVSKMSEDDRANLEEEYVDRLNGAEENRFFRLPEEQQVQELQAWYDTNGGGLPEGNTAKYSDYQMPGGENYRELLLKMPGKLPTKDQFELGPPKFNDWVKQTPEMQNMVGVYHKPTGNHMWNSGSREEALASLNDPENLSLADTFNRGTDSGVQFHSSHWPDDPNTLLHMRMNDRDIPDVGKTLHLEELQSDWHQKGRKYGYNTSADRLAQAKQEADSTYKALQNALEKRHENQLNDMQAPSGTMSRWGALNALAQEAMREIHYGPDPFNSDAPLRYGPERELAQKAIDAKRNYEMVASELQNTNQVPDAPFKQSWPELGLKRAIAKAAQEGYDAISWTPGQQQADRYSLSKHVDTLTYKPDLHFLYGYKNGENVIKKDVPPNELSDYVGKEVAERLLNSKLNELGEHSLTGENLDVGGQGMKAFYDKMLPNIANKIGKKYGAQVEYKDLVSEKPKIDLQPLDAIWYDPKMLKLYGYKHGASSPEFEHDVSREQLPEYIGQEATNRLFQSAPLHGQHHLTVMQRGGFKSLMPENSGVKVPVLRLTSKLKEQALKGLPMFARGGAVRGEQTAFSSTGANSATAMSSSSAMAQRGGAIKHQQSKHKVVGKRHEQNYTAEQNRADGGGLPTKKPPPQWNPPVIPDQWAKSLSPETQRVIGLNALRQKTLQDIGVDPVYSFEKFDDSPTADELARENRFGNKATIDQLKAIQNQMEQHQAQPSIEAFEQEPKSFAKGGRVVAKNINHKPSGAQKAAGNYAKDRIHIHGLEIMVENAKGSKRSGIGRDGKHWEVIMPCHYGYIKRV